MNITAQLNQYRQSPRKVRLVADYIKGKSASDAYDALNLLTKRASQPIQKLLASAVSNAKNNFGIERDDLIVKNLTVDAGAILYRRMPRARGTAYPIRKRTCNVVITLSVKGDTEVKEKTNTKKVEVEKVAPKKTVKKTTKK